MKKTTKSNSRGIISKVTTKTQKLATKANDMALDTTEKVVTESIHLTAQWQKVADTALKGGLKLAANQQDLVFDVLTEVKSHIKTGKKKFSKLVA